MKNKIRKTCILCGRKRYLRDLEYKNVYRRMVRFAYVCLNVDYCLKYKNFKKNLKKNE